MSDKLLVRIPVFLPEVSPDKVMVLTFLKEALPKRLYFNHPTHIFEVSMQDSLDAFFRTLFVMLIVASLFVSSKRVNSILRSILILLLSFVDLPLLILKTHINISVISSRRIDCIPSSPLSLARSTF